jgi:hypothetical protein
MITFSKLFFLWWSFLTPHAPVSLQVMQEAFVNSFVQSVGGSLINATGAGSSSSTTTSGITTTGANLLIISCSGSGTLSVSDSKSNTWTLIGNYGSAGGGNLESWYVDSSTPTVGTSHTATCSGTSTAVSFAAYKQATSTYLTVDINNGFSGSSTSCNSTSFTPANSNEIILAFWNANGVANSLAINDSFTIDTVTYNNSSYQNSIARLFQTTAAAVNITYSWSITSGTTASICGLSSFK